MPQALPPRQLQVTFQTHSIQVAHRVTGAVYLSGALERGIVPEDCLWTQSGGAAEDGCLLVLKKMNLELLQRSLSPSTAWGTDRQMAGEMLLHSLVQAMPLAIGLRVQGATRMITATTAPEAVLVLHEHRLSADTAGSCRIHT